MEDWDPRQPWGLDLVLGTHLRSICWGEMSENLVPKELRQQLPEHQAEATVAWHPAAQPASCCPQGRRHSEAALESTTPPSPSVTLRTVQLWTGVVCAQ